MKPKIIVVRDKAKAVQTAKEFLYSLSNNQTALFLSGGSTPSGLYQALAQEKKLEAGAVAMVDERFGKKFHENSNEKMIQESGLIDYFNKGKIKFYPILKNKTISKTSKDYQEKISELLSVYKNKIVILGIGEDGHTAGVPAIAKISKPIVLDKTSLVTFYDDKGTYGKRITLTFNSLSQFDVLIIFVVGEGKKKALEQMFAKGRIEDIPARFFLKKEIAEKTILITDQEL